MRLLDAYSLASRSPNDVPFDTLPSEGFGPERSAAAIDVASADADIRISEGTCRPPRLSARPFGSSAMTCYSLPVKVRERITLIESDGWFQVRARGNHRQFRHPRKPGTVTIAGRPGIDVPPGTLNSVLKQAGLTK